MLTRGGNRGQGGPHPPHTHRVLSTGHGSSLQTEARGSAFPGLEQGRWARREGHLGDCGR